MAALLHEMVHAYLMIQCGASKDNRTIDRNLPSQQSGHAGAFLACLDAVQARLGPTRYCHLRINGAERGGTVAVGSNTRIGWDIGGGFMLEGEDKRKIRRLMMGG